MNKPASYFPSSIVFLRTILFLRLFPSRLFTNVYLIYSFSHLFEAGKFLSSNYCLHIKAECWLAPISLTSPPETVSLSRGLTRTTSNHAKFQQIATRTTYSPPPPPPHTHTQTSTGPPVPIWNNPNLEQSQSGTIPIWNNLSASAVEAPTLSPQF